MTKKELFACIGEECCRLAERVCEMNFNQSRVQFVACCAELRRSVSHAMPGGEFKSVSHLSAELALLAKRLGFATTPITPGSKTTNEARIDVMRFCPPFYGPSFVTIVSVWPTILNDDELFFVAPNAETLRRIDNMLDSWAVAADDRLLSDFVHDYEPSERDLQLLVLTAINEILRNASASRVLNADKVADYIDVTQGATRIYDDALTSAGEISFDAESSPEAAARKARAAEPLTDTESDLANAIVANPAQSAKQLAKSLGWNDANKIHKLMGKDTRLFARGFRCFDGGRGYFPPNAVT